MKRMSPRTAIAAWLALLVGAVAFCSTYDSGGSDSPPLTRAECSNLQMAFNGAMYLVDKQPPGSAERDRRLAEAKRYDNQMRAGGCYR